MKVSQVRQEAAPLLKLGFAFMASGCLMMGAAYAVRTMVLRLAGYEAAGFYQAAWTLGGCMSELFCRPWELIFTPA